MLLAAGGYTQDLTPSVETGLGFYYAICAAANLFFAWRLHRAAGSGRRAAIWYFWTVLFSMLAAIYFARLHVVLPQPFKDTLDMGFGRALLGLGFGPGSVGAVNAILGAVLYAVLAAGALDALCTYVIKKGARETADRIFRPLFRGAAAGDRMVAWLLAVTFLAIFAEGIGAVTFFLLSIAIFAAFIVWRKFFTQPGVVWGVLNFTLLFGGFSMTDYDFRDIIIKPDNIPIVGMVFIVGFFTWLAFRMAVINDERMDKGEPPVEKEGDEKVLVWPDLVYTELICMVLVTVVLIVWSVALPAPLEQPASSTKTPNPSKAPWYFLGLQEMLVYYDPWLAGVVLPTFIILGLIAIPYIDFNQKGNGYFTFKQRPMAILTFLFGFIILWVVLIFLGTFLRGPNWNFFGLYEPRDPHKLVPLNNVDLSEYFWVRGLGVLWEHPSGGVSLWVIFMRELPGIILILLYFLVLPPLMARWMRNLAIRMGFVRFFTFAILLLFMASLPIKMVLRWAFNLKYIVGIPEYFFNV